MTTQSMAQRIMDHILGVVFKLPSPNVLKTAFDHGMYISPEAFITEMDKTLLKYIDNTSALKTIPLGVSGLLKSFKRLVAHLVLQGATINNDFWINIMHGDYVAF